MDKQNDTDIKKEILSQINSILVFLSNSILIEKELSFYVSSIILYKNGRYSISLLLLNGWLDWSIYRYWRFTYKINTSKASKLEYQFMNNYNYIW